MSYIPFTDSQLRRIRTSRRIDGPFQEQAQPVDHEAAAALEAAAQDQEDGQEDGREEVADPLTPTEPAR
jgi:hypothetical protein